MTTPCLSAYSPTTFQNHRRISFLGYTQIHFHNHTANGRAVGYRHRAHDTCRFGIHSYSNHSILLVIYPYLAYLNLENTSKTAGYPFSYAIARHNQKHRFHKPLGRFYEIHSITPDHSYGIRFRIRYRHIIYAYLQYVKRIPSSPGVSCWSGSASPYPTTSLARAIHSHKRYNSNKVILWPGVHIDRFYKPPLLLPVHIHTHPQSRSANPQPIHTLRLNSHPLEIHRYFHAGHYY